MKRKLWIMMALAVLIAAVQHEMYDLEAVNRLLTRCGQPPLVRDYA